MWRTLHRTKVWIAQLLAARYVAGPHLGDGVRLCRSAGERGWSSILCPWDSPGDSIQTVRTSYMAALDAIHSERLRCYLSVKVPALRYDFGLVRELAQCAREFRVRLHFDAHGPDSATPTFQLLERVVPVYSQVGCTLPARWRRSLSDVQRVIDLGVAVRVVKGQWPDAASPDLDPDIGFRRLIDLLAGRAANVGVATHDGSLAGRCLERLQACGTPCELEQLLGLPPRSARVGQRLGVPIRLYVPYGHSCSPYTLSDARRRPAVLLWALRDLLNQGIQLWPTAGEHPNSTEVVSEFHSRALSSLKHK